MSYVDSRWQTWIQAVMPSLRAGMKLPVPAVFPHPRRVGFAVTKLAEPIGQARDWSAATADGGRLHLHESKDGTFTIHLDKVNPERGVVPALVHWFTESPTGKFAAVALVSTAALNVAGAFLGAEPPKRGRKKRSR